MKHTDWKAIERILNGTVETPPYGNYMRLHDDHDGTEQGELAVLVADDGDAHVCVFNDHFGSLRFRSYFGGGSSLRVHTALMILAHAIRMDNADRPNKREPAPQAAEGRGE